MKLHEKDGVQCGHGEKEREMMHGAMEGTLAVARWPASTRMMGGNTRQQHCFLPGFGFAGPGRHDYIQTAKITHNRLFRRLADTGKATMMHAGRHTTKTA